MKELLQISVIVFVVSIYISASSEDFSVNLTDSENSGFWVNNSAGNPLFLISGAGDVGLGISTTNPGEKFHMGDGNLFIEGGGETAFIMKRHVTWCEEGVPQTKECPSGQSKNPIFKFGRIVQAGDGDPEFRFIYEDDDLRQQHNADPNKPYEYTIMEFDRKGIVASVKPEERGSHFEGFVLLPDPEADNEPIFRLNSYPSMQLEFGEGGTGNLTDVAMRRPSPQTLSFIRGDLSRSEIEGVVETMRLDTNGNIGIATTAPNYKLEVNGSAGKPGGGSWSDSSDKRLKTDIMQINGKEALRKLTRLRGVTFKWRNPEEHSDGVRACIIAQELERLFPEWVEQIAPKGKDKVLIFI